MRGRDEFRAGEIWNSNSVISWLIVRGGLPLEDGTPARNGRAGGWIADVVVTGGHEQPRTSSQASHGFMTPADRGDAERRL